MELRRQEFDSMAAWLHFLAQPTDMPDERRTSQNTDHDRIPWSGTHTYQEAVKLAEEGWEEGVEKIERFSVRLSEELIGMLHIPEVIYDVTGDMLDIGRHVRGEPEDFMTVVPAEIEQEPRILKIGVNFGASSSIDTDVMIRKGAAIVALVDLLEKHGKRIEVDAISTAFATNRAYTIVTIKHANGPLQLANLVYALAHPSAHRRLAFSSWEHFDADFRRSIGIPGGGYGSPRDLSPEEREVYDIYVSGLSGGQEWTEASSLEYVRAQLSEQGIYLEREVIA